jgi:UDP-glucose 4-epimerase
MKVLVTGAAGFIGSHLCELLIKRGIKVTGVDNLSKGNIINLKNIINNSNFIFKICNTNDTKLIKDLSIGCSAVFHLSDESDIQNALDHPESYFLNNINGLYSVLMAMKLNNIKKLFFPSSTTVFGSSAEVPISEGYGPLLPENLYGASKVSAEAFLNAWSFAYDVDILIFRFAAIIGGRQDHGVVHDFVKRLKLNSSLLQVLGNGSQKRSFVLVDDCVDIVFEYFQNKMKPGFQIVHLANPDVITIKEVAELVCAKLNLQSNIIQYESSELGWIGDSKTNELDITQLKFNNLLPKRNSKDAVIEAAYRLNKQYSENLL